MNEHLSKVRSFRARWGAAIAFLFLAVGGIVALHASETHANDRLYQTQLAQCERGNALRTESNRRIGSHVKDRDVLMKFIQSAEVARRAAGSPTDIQAANEYHKLAQSLRSVTFKATPLVDCHKVIAKP